MYIHSLGFNWKLINDGDFVNVKLCLNNVLKEHAKLGLGHTVKSAEALDQKNVGVWSVRRRFS